jgi:hypothetical protein
MCVAGSSIGQDERRPAAAAANGAGAGSDWLIPADAIVL